MFMGNCVFLYLPVYGGINMEQYQNFDKFEISGYTDDLTFLFPEGKPVRNPKHRVYLIIGLQGEAQIKIDSKRYVLQKNGLIYLTPNHLLSSLSRSNDFLFEYLSFDFDFLSDFPLLLKADISDQVGAMPFLQLDMHAFAVITKYYDFINDRYKNSTNRSEIVKGLLFSLIVEVSKMYSGQNICTVSSRKNELADAFFRLLHRYYKEERTALFYAGRLCISDKYLFRVIKQTTGSTFHYWVSDFVLREAKLLLKSTEKSVTEIAEYLNFPNSSFFARFFRKHTGMSPMQFKQQK